MSWLVWLTCKRVRELSRELAKARSSNMEALESLRAMYGSQQAWKARALTAEARLGRAMRSGHPSCRPITEGEIEAFRSQLDAWTGGDK